MEGLQRQGPLKGLANFISLQRIARKSPTCCLGPCGGGLMPSLEISRQLFKSRIAPTVHTEGNPIMEFGYFTLSDNHYDNNQRSANQVVTDILDEAVYAEEVGLNSAWIG